MKVSFVEEFFKVKLNADKKDFSEVSTDTRTLLPGALYVALKGENFDGHKFVEKAFESGASAVLISNAQYKINDRCILVESVLKSFSELSKAWQNKVAPSVVGITGSNGKTTAKFFSAQLLENFFEVCYSPKSYNNEVGVPITQAMLKESDQVLISEIGTNNKGEIRSLTDQVDPELCVVTTVGPSHLEGFGTVENVAKEKSEIYKSKKLKSAVFNLDNPWTQKMCESFSGSKITFSSKDKSADVFLEAKQKSLTELFVKGHIKGLEVEATCGVFGEHHVTNIMVAISAALYLRVSPEDIFEHLNVFSTPWGRSQVVPREAGVPILFDGYNSNLQSMEALLLSLKPFVQRGDEVHLILGEMLELGGETKQMHRALGEKVAALSPSFVTFLGSSSADFEQGLGAWKNNKNSMITDAYDESLAIKIQTVLNPKTTVVLKGSRGVRLERFFDALGV